MFATRWVLHRAAHGWRPGRSCTPGCMGVVPRVTCAAIAGALLAAGAIGAPLSAQSLPDGMPGRYNLVEIEGHALPWAPAEPGRPADAPVVEVLASTLVVRPDGHFVMSMAYRVRQATAEHIFTNPFTGTIDRDANGFVMHWDGAGLTPATWEAERFSFRNEGQSYGYRRQPSPPPANGR